MKSPFALRLNSISPKNLADYNDNIVLYAKNSNILPLSFRVFTKCKTTLIKVE